MPRGSYDWTVVWGDTFNCVLDSSSISMRQSFKLDRIREFTFDKKKKA